MKAIVIAVFNVALVSAASVKSHGGPIPGPPTCIKAKLFNMDCSYGGSCTRNEACGTLDVYAKIFNLAYRYIQAELAKFTPVCQKALNFNSVDPYLRSAVTGCTLNVDPTNLQLSSVAVSAFAHLAVAFPNAHLLHVSESKPIPIANVAGVVEALNGLNPVLGENLYKYLLVYSLKQAQISLRQNLWHDLWMISWSIIQDMDNVVNDWEEANANDNALSQLYALVLMVQRGILDQNASYSPKNRYTTLFGPSGDLPQKVTQYCPMDKFASAVSGNPLTGDHDGIKMVLTKYMELYWPETVAHRPASFKTSAIQNFMAHIPTQDVFYGRLALVRMGRGILAYADNADVHKPHCVLRVIKMLNDEALAGAVDATKENQQLTSSLTLLGVALKEWPFMGAGITDAADNVLGSYRFMAEA